MDNLIKKAKVKSFIIVIGILLTTLYIFSENSEAAQKKYVTRGDVISTVNDILGADTPSIAVTAKDLKKDSKYYTDFSIALHAKLISPNKDNKLLAEKKATNWYIANMLSRTTGLSAKEILGSKKTNGYMTEKDFSTFIKKLIPNIISSNTDKLKSGTVVINKPDITLKNQTITGNLIIGDGVSDGTIILENVIVKGKTYIRGGGAESIYVKGSSELSNVKIKQVYNKVRLHVANTALITQVAIKKGCNDIICEGNFKNIVINNPNHSLILNNASIQSLTVSQKSISLETNGDTTIGTTIIKPSASNVKMNLNQKTIVKNLDIHGESLEIMGKGHINTINNAANNTSINTSYSQIKTEDGITGTLINGKPADTNKNETEISDNSSSNNNSTSNPPSYSNVEIKGVYAKPGSVQVILNRAVPLNKDSFFIGCPTGKDMTILKVETVEGTEKNKIYNLSTAFYTDNTYLLEITLPNDKKITKEFLTNSALPVFTNISVERLSTTTGTFSFTADNSGILYYILVPENINTKTNLGTSLFSLIGSQVPKDGQEIKNNGEEVLISHGFNTISFDNIKEGTPYTIYYAISDGGNNTIPIIQAPVQINADPLVTNPSDILMEECIAIDNHTIKVRFNKPTEKPLEIGAFHVTCPGQSDITLGHLETSDNQMYTIYLKENYFMKSNNTFTVTVNFPDNTTAIGSFYGDFVWPTITSLNVKRIEPSIIKVAFKSDEVGTLHYVISETEITKAEDIMQHPDVKTANIFAGANEIQISDIAEGIDQYLCIVPVDKLGNTPAFVSREKIPTDITPDITPNANEITNIKVGKNSMNFTTLTVSLKEEEDLYSLDIKYNVTIYTLEGENSSEPRIMSLNNVDDGSTLKGKNFLFGLNVTLPTGRYKMEINLPVGGTVAKEFTIQ